MATPSQQQSIEEARQYVRWTPHNSPYAIELKLQLVPALIGEIDDAETLAIEIGGVLLGSVIELPTPTLRIQGFELIARDPADGPVFMLDPAEQERFSTLRQGATERGASAVGFFRTHIRPGPLRPSLADKSLLLGHFTEPVYLVLLIEAREPRLAAFFLALNGQLPSEPAVPEFRFGEKALRSAREIQPSLFSETRAYEPVRNQSRPSSAVARSRRYALVVILLVLALAAGAILWPLLNGVLSSWDRLDVQIEGSAPILKVSWNHSAPEIGRANDGVLVISDGASHRTIQLGPDELKFGIVQYQPRTQLVRVTLTLNMPGSTSVSQSAEWQPNS
ncbi:MAG: hypothetical protein JOY62_00705 [Acidobacteriaceae bacterium]|nr:hypothetical protein [Acidobacteriaceae bacterium]MBV9778465.1 hypothetical protein [Acidobacteriaceae bacterium]